MSRCAPDNIIWFEGPQCSFVGQAIRRANVEWSDILVSLSGDACV